MLRNWKPFKNFSLFLFFPKKHLTSICFFSIIRVHKHQELMYSTKRVVFACDLWQPNIKYTINRLFHIDIWDGNTKVIQSWQWIKHPIDCFLLSRNLSRKAKLQWEELIGGFAPDQGELFYGEFDPGSEWTLAACLTHASRTRTGYSLL